MKTSSLPRLVSALLLISGALHAQGALSIVTSSLPNGNVAVAYPAQTLQATGGTLPYTWSLSSGQLPSGIVFSPEGVLSGIPITAGTFSFALRVADFRQV